MAGRRRRASTSSVETVDNSQIRWRQETSVVRSVPKGTLSDDWPIFELQDAAVFDKDGQTMVNALHVGHQGPFIVRGNLIIDDPAQRTHLIMKVRASTPLEVRRCTSYSIGESPDGRPLIWVSGLGGWYEIDPCPAYQPIYNKMCEATTMYYNVIDIYTEDPPKKTKKSKNPIMDELAQVYHKYAARIGDGATLEEVIERANEHSAFFLDQFSHNDGIMADWSSTAFYKKITTDNAEQRKRIQEASENLRPKPFASEPSSRENTRSRSTKSSSVEIIDSKTFQSQSQRPTPAPLASKPVDKPIQHDAPRPVVAHFVQSDQKIATDSPLQSVLAALEDVYDMLGSSKRGMVFQTTMSKLYFNCSFPSYKDSRVGSYKQPVQDALHYYSRALVATLDAKYHNHEFFEELKKMTAIPFQPMAYKPSDFPVTFAPRRSQPRKINTSQAPSSLLHSVEDDRDHSPSVSETPKPQGKRPTRTPGKSSLRPISRGSKKRPRDEFESDAGSESPGAKRSHFFDGDEIMDDALDLDSQDDNETDDDDVVSGNRDNTSKYDLEPIKLVIRAEKIPDTSPSGPLDTWTCSEEGCGHIVRGGDEEECQERIRQHFRDHDKELTRVNLAVREGARGHLPINHLLEKIKQMTGEQEESSVQPIKRKLIV